MANINPPGKPDLRKLQYKRKNGKKWDLAPLGLLYGLVFPIFGLVFLYFFFFGNWNFSTYLNMFFNSGVSADMNNSSKMLSLSIITNLIPFYFFLNRKHYQVTKGIILASFLLGVVIFMYKFVWQ